MKITLFEVKSILEGISRVDGVKDRIANIEDGEAKVAQSDGKEKESKWDKIKRNNVRVTRVPEKEEGEQVVENLFEEIMMEIFPNLVEGNRCMSP